MQEIIIRQIGENYSPPLLIGVLNSSCTNAVPRSDSKPTTQISQKVATKPQIIKRQVSKAATEKALALDAKAKLLFNDLKPVSSGEGLLVAEPIVLETQGEDIPLGEFGAACSRWLQLHVGGQGEVGKTPLWSSVAAMQNQMSRPNLRLTENDIDSVTNSLGLTRVVISTITPLEVADHYSLQYRIFDTSSPKVLTELSAFSLQGTKAEILAQLPKQANALSRALGVKAPSIPPKVGVLPEEMQLLGRGDWTFAQGLSPEDLNQLHKIASNEPLAALLSLEYEARTDVQTEWQYELERALFYDQTFCDSELKRKMVDILISKAGKNALSMAEMCAIDIQQLRPHKTQSVALVDKYLYNYALRVVGAQWWIYDGGHRQGTQFARNSVQCSPRNPYAWIYFGDCLETEASKIRDGRYANDIYEHEWKFLKQRYAQSSFAMRKATSLDSNNQKAWHELSISTVFEGDSKSADAAFWKAYELDNQNMLHLRWGLEMYQPKWSTDTKSLAKVTALASSPTNLAWIYPDVASALQAINEQNQATTLQQITRKELEAQLQKNPNDIMVQARLANPSFGASQGQYATIVGTRPKSSLINWLAAVALSNTDPKAAIPFYRQTIQLDPLNPIAVREISPNIHRQM